MNINIQLNIDDPEETPAMAASLLGEIIHRLSNGEKKFEQGFTDGEYKVEVDSRPLWVFVDDESEN